MCRVLLLLTFITLFFAACTSTTELEAENGTVPEVAGVDLAFVKQGDEWFEKAEGDGYFSNMTVNYEIINNGTETAVPSITDCVIQCRLENSVSIMFPSSLSQSSIEAGETVSSSFHIPAGCDITKDVTIIMVLDIDNDVEETNEENNSAKVTFSN